ncbi:Cytochrome c biogenesis protein CcsA [Limihaloglobus sulfuriphilus]|uniref:Cytochrome c biogenesis protein CcsA n=1 Tax=Limihaloglobus sulfuriphilus TaxID=1851148 RepID=A0A1Q2MDT3_9BACT|nr:cytochrome c biogenesis protein CcsA [Limihaloglobus sulfuriphilus]AQQ70422.1 Cytochrome c biogenesis protein CcsA [Limihaloglobus sulfuriphilus]
MTLKTDLLGYLIYIMMAMCLLSFVLAVIKLEKTARRVFMLSFITGIAAFVVRWINKGQLPLQSMFEVFLFLAAAAYPCYEISRRKLGIDMLKADTLIVLAILFPCGFIFSGEAHRLPPALQSPYFIPHVAVYIFAYMLLTKAAVMASIPFFRGSDNLQISQICETGAYRLCRAGFPLLVLGLLLGSLWAKAAWSRYWGWDPKELWSLATVLVYVGYFHFRYTYGQKMPKLNCMIVVMGFIFIVITLLWVNISNIFTGMHNYA